MCLIQNYLSPLFSSMGDPVVSAFGYDIFPFRANRCIIECSKKIQSEKRRESYVYAFQHGISWHQAAD